MSVAVRRALYGKLAGDTTLTNMLAAAAPGLTHGIYHELAPEGASFPYVVFNQQSGVPTWTFQQGAPILKDELWLIKGVDHNTDTDPVDNIASRLETLLNDATISIAAATTQYLRWDGPVEYAEETDGETYRHAGGVYRLKYSAT